VGSLAQEPERSVFQAAVASSTRRTGLESDEQSHIVKVMKLEGYSSRQMLRFSVRPATSAAEAQASLLNLRDKAKTRARGLRNWIDGFMGIWYSVSCENDLGNTGGPFP
jgi:hypothetical protein